MTHGRIELILLNYWTSALLLCRHVCYPFNQRWILRNAWITAGSHWNGPCSQQRLPPAETRVPRWCSESSSHTEEKDFETKNAEFWEKFRCTLKSSSRNSHWQAEPDGNKATELFLKIPNSFVAMSPTFKVLLQPESCSDNRKCCSSLPLHITQEKLYLQRESTSTARDAAPGVTKSQKKIGFSLNYL